MLAVRISDRMVVLFVSLLQSGWCWCSTKIAAGSVNVGSVNGTNIRRQQNVGKLTSEHHPSSISTQYARETRRVSGKLMPPMCPMSDVIDYLWAHSALLALVGEVQRVQYRRHSS
jgi:hypothetical protein